MTVVVLVRFVTSMGLDFAWLAWTTRTVAQDDTNSTIISEVCVFFYGFSC